MLHCITFYPIENSEAFGVHVFKHRRQEAITKVDETVACKFIYGHAVVLWEML